MFKKFIKHYQNKFNLISILVLGLFLVSSCTYNGCIEADDFGEFENQILRVYANTTDNSCKFDTSKKANDTIFQGSGMIKCLREDLYSNYKGCDKINDYDTRYQCFVSCYDKCQLNLVKDSLGTEPAWIATNSISSGLKPSITIMPDSEISIKVKGNVKLGEEIYSSYIFTNSKSNAYDTIKLDNEPSSSSIYTKYFIDLVAGSSTSIRFYSNWVDTADPSPDTGATRTIGPGTSRLVSPTTGITVDSSSNTIINGIKRVLIYTIPHPNGYVLSNSCIGSIPAGSSNKESTCIQGFPLLPDPRVWGCTYPSATASNPATTANCSNSLLPANNYRAFYPQSTYSAADINNYYPVSNSSKLAQLNIYGGFIRWTSDMLKQTSFDPFVRDNVSCDSLGNCSNLETMDQYIDGRILGNISSRNAEITNRNNFAKRLYFRSITSDANCKSGYSLTVTNLDQRNINYNIPQAITISSSWSSNFVDLEPNGGKISIGALTRASSSGVNCGNFIALKYIPYHDILIEKSGLVKFTNVGATGSCTLNARIINTLATDEEYYEFPTDSQDPFSSLSVPGLSAGGSINWSNEVFVRKNQAIRISPTSWNSSFITPNGFAQCGIGMAMFINPKPAAICKGTANDYVFNSLCDIDYNLNNLIIGCKPTSIDCEDPEKNSYCPKSSNCQFKLENCIDGTETTAKTGCTTPNTNTIGTCTYTTTITAAKCTSCSSKLLEATKEVPKYAISNVDACFDLENYRGRVSSISLNANGISDNLKNKGLKFLESFNGNYGSLWPSAESNETVSSNIVHQLKNPIIVSQNSRLIFTYIDGGDFTQSQTALNNNTGGLHIKLGNSMSFKNGDWLQIMLCSDSGYNCYGSNPTHISGQSKITNHRQPTTDIERQYPNYALGNYKFDIYGNIYRYTPPNPNEDCKINGVVTQIGSSFYCHTYESRTNNDLNAMTTTQKQTRLTNIEKLRLSFKILDPDQLNCYVDKSLGGFAYDGVNPPFDGVLINNPYADKVSDASSYCDKKSFTNDAQCTKKFTCVNPYTNNSGYYDVMVSIKSSVNNNISKIISGIIQPFSEIFDGYKIGDKNYPGETERLYRNIITNPQYVVMMQFAIVLMFVFYGVGYLMGVSELTQSELVSRFFKIAMIYLFTNETGWEWYKFLVVRLFKDGTDFLTFSLVGNFDDSPEILSAISNNDYSNKGLLFRSVDKVLNIAFSDTVSKKVSSFLFSSFFGWAYLFIFYFGILKYVYAVATTLMLFITAKFFISILFIVGPIFILFTLFNQTKELFDRWLNYMISFSLQQILIATIMTFFSLLIYEIIKLILSFKICWEEIWVISSPIRISLISFWTISNVPKSTFVQAGSYSAGINGSIPSLFSILLFWLVSSMMKHMITFMDSAASSLGNGLQASTLSSGLKSAAIKIKNTAKSYGKKYMNKALKEAGLEKTISRLDNYLFDTGEISEKKKKQARANKVRDSMNTSSMKESGKNAVSEYKNKNADELSKMTSQDRENKLREVRDEAMKNKGRELGLSDDKIKDFMNKGQDFKATSTNPLVNGAKYLAHAVNNMRGKNKGLANKSIDTSLSQSDMKNSIKKMDSEQRANFLNDLKNSPNQNNKDKINVDKLEKYADRQNRKDDASDKKETKIGAKLARMKVGAGDKISNALQKGRAAVNAVKKLFK